MHLCSEFNASNFEPCAAVRTIGHLNVPAVGVHYLLDNTQSETSPPVTGRIARLKHVILFAFRDVWPIVFNVEAVIQRTNSDCYVFAAVFHCVPYEIFERVEYRG